MKPSKITKAAKTTKRPRLFSFARETELAHVHLWVQDTAEQLAVEQVVDAFIDIARTRKLTPKTLTPIVAGSKHPSEMLRTLAITRLVVLTHYFEHAAEAFLELATHDKVEIRQFVASSLLNAPDKLQSVLLPRFLADPESVVRQAAIPCCVATERWPLLEEASERESDPTLRRALDLAMDQRP